MSHVVGFSKFPHCFYPFTAPDNTPSIIYLCRKIYNKIIGIIDKVSIAIKPPQSTLPYAPCIVSCTATGIVLYFEPSIRYGSR